MTSPNSNSLEFVSLKHSFASASPDVSILDAIAAKEPLEHSTLLPAHTTCNVQISGKNQKLLVASSYTDLPSLVDVLPSLVGRMPYARSRVDLNCDFSKCMC